MVDITRAHLDTHVDPKLRRRVRMYLGISAAIIAVIAYRMVTSGGILYSLCAFAVGLSVGVLLSRMFKVAWDKDVSKVFSRMDAYGTIFLVASIAFEIGGEHLIREWLHGPEVLTVILSLAGGSVLGRGLGMGRKMLLVLRENI